MNSEQCLNWLKAASTVPGYQRRPLVMGILNVTPDSFSDAGCYLDPAQAYERAQVMIAQGADLIDVGGESSRPGAESISCDEELARVIPVIERIRASQDICMSIDTCKAAVMREAVAAGVSLINDINALRGEGALSAAAQLHVPVCLMHRQGTPKTMQDNPHYADDIVDEINDFFHQRITACLKAGMTREHLILDPGFGFGKSASHNLLLIQRIAEFQRHHLPVMLGVSRKRTIGSIVQKTVLDRMPGGLAVAVFAAFHGVGIIRTHDVDETHQAMQMVDAICRTDIN